MLHWKEIYLLKTIWGLGLSFWPYMVYFNDQQSLIWKQDWMVRKGKIPVRRDQDERRALCLKLGQVKMISLKVEI